MANQQEHGRDQMKQDQNKGQKEPQQRDQAQQGADEGRDDKNKQQDQNRQRE